MQRKYFIPNEKKEKLFHTELVKYGVKYEKAAKVAKIMAFNGLDNLTPEEERLVTEACQEWLVAHKRCKQIYRN